MFGIEGGGFIGAFGIKKGFYVEDGQIKFGAQEPEYKAFLSLFREWYAEGLIDKNLAAVDSETQDTNMTTGRSGAVSGMLGRGSVHGYPSCGRRIPMQSLCQRHILL